MLFVKKLKGLSGCEIELYQVGNNNIVKKTSSGLEYNDRLIKQVEKQKMFESTFVKSPKIFDEGIDEYGNYFFLMEYINGMSFSGYLNTYSFKSSIDIFTKILSSLVDIHGKPSNECVEINRITAKINDLKSKLIQYTDVFDILETKIPNKLTQAKVHGDLTFENIMISHTGEIYYIDFLDSFVDNVYIDLGKLQQELSLYWSVRHNKITNEIILKYEKLQDVFNKCFASKMFDQETILFFSILTILRILPYTKDTHEIQLINNMLSIWTKKLK